MGKSSTVWIGGNFQSQQKGKVGFSWGKKNIFFKSQKYPNKTKKLGLPRPWCPVVLEFFSFHLQVIIFWRIHLQCYFFLPFFFFPSQKFSFFQFLCACFHCNLHIPSAIQDFSGPKLCPASPPHTQPHEITKKNPKISLEDRISTRYISTIIGVFLANGENIQDEHSLSHRSINSCNVEVEKATKIGILLLQECFRARFYSHGE